MDTLWEMWGRYYVVFLALVPAAFCLAALVDAVQYFLGHETQVPVFIIEITACSLVLGLIGAFFVALAHVAWTYGRSGHQVPKN